MAHLSTPSFALKTQGPEALAQGLASPPADSESAFALSGAHGLRNAAELRKQLLNALDLPGPLLVDAGQADSADITTLQLLLAAQKSAAAKGKHLTITAAADSAIVKVMKATGLLSPTGSPAMGEAGSWIISESANHDQDGSHH